MNKRVKTFVAQKKIILQNSFYEVRSSFWVDNDEDEGWGSCSRRRPGLWEPGTG